MSYHTAEKKDQTSDRIGCRNWAHVNRISTLPTTPQYKQISPHHFFPHRHSLWIIIKTRGLGPQKSRKNPPQNELMKVHFRWFLTHIYTKQVCLYHKNTEAIFTAHYLRISSIFKRPTHKWNRKPKILHSLVGHCTHQRHNCCVSQKLPTIVLHYSQHQKTGQKLMTSEFPTSDVR